MHDPKAVMPEETACIFNILKNFQQLNQFYLIGGTAISLHIGHRLSEDLDFITKEQKLPSAAIQATLDKLRQMGIQVTRNDDATTYDEFQIAGMELHDYSQNFIVGKKCKVTFFTADDHHARLLQSTLSPNGFSIATLDELQDLKAVVCASRSSSRDWLDLYLLEKLGFGVAGWKHAFEKSALRPDQFQQALDRIKFGKLPPSDPGFQTLLKNPPTIHDITRQLKVLIQEFERSMHPRSIRGPAST